MLPAVAAGRIIQDVLGRVERLLWGRQLDAARGVRQVVNGDAQRGGTTYRFKMVTRPDATWCVHQAA